MFWQAAQITIDKLRGIVAWRTMAEGKQEGAIDVAGLASKYNVSSRLQPKAQQHNT